jgi:tetratricopeptide (TPR) repeat protein
MRILWGLVGCGAVLWGGLTCIKGFYGLQGLHYLDTRQYQQCLQATDSCIALDPNNAEAYNLKGVVLAQIGVSEKSKVKIEEALKASSTALTLGDDSLGSYYDHLNRGQCYVYLGEFQKAQAELTNAIGLNPEQPDAYFWRAATLEKLGRHNSAMVDLNKANSLGHRGLTFADGLKLCGYCVAENVKS